MSSNKFCGEYTVSFKLRRGNLNSGSLTHCSCLGPPLCREPTKHILWCCALSTWEFNRTELITCSLCSLVRSIGFLEINHSLAYWPLCKPVVPTRILTCQNSFVSTVKSATGSDLNPPWLEVSLTKTKHNKIKGRDFFLPQAAVFNSFPMTLFISAMWFHSHRKRENRSSSRINDHTEVNPRLLFPSSTNKILFYFVSPDPVQNRTKIVSICLFLQSLLLECEIKYSA